MPGKNPFEFGRELPGTELADREEEIAAVVRAMSEVGRLFVIGPRRFGKTSILRAAAEQSERLRLRAGDVRAIIEGLVRRDDPFYTQMWNRLTAAQQRALHALVDREGERLLSKDVVHRYGCR